MSQMATLVLFVISAIGLLPLYALFSIAQSAVLATQEDRFNQLVSAGTTKSEAVLKTTRMTRSDSATAHMGGLVVLISIGWVMSRLWLTLSQVWPSGASPWVMTVVGLWFGAFMIAVYVALGLIVPKAVTSQGSGGPLSRAALALVSIVRVPLYPLVEGTHFIARLVLKASQRFQADNLTDVYSKNALPYTALQSYRYGLLGVAQRELFTQLFSFKEKTARDILVPLQEMACLSGQMRLSEALEVVQHLGFTRYPVMDGSREKVIGISHFRDLIDNHDTNPRLFVTDVMEPALHVPSHLTMTELLQKLLSHQTPIAVIVNEHDRVEGLVTVQDILREFFVPVSKEEAQEEAQKGPLIRALSHDLFEFDGRLIVQEIEDILGIRLSRAGLETIGNHISARLNRKPRIGDHVKVNGVVFDVLEMKGARITRLRAQKTRELPPDIDFPPIEKKASSP